MTITIRQFVGGDFGSDIFDAALLDPNDQADFIDSEITATRFVVDNTASGIRTVVTGSGFRVGPDGPSSGVVDGLSFFRGFSTATPLGSMTGLGFDIVAFGDALDAEDQGNSGPLDALFANRVIDYDAATATRNAAGGFFDGVEAGGFDANDILRGSAFNDLFEASRGADFYDGRDGFDAVTYDTGDDAGPRAITANFATGRVVNTVGLVDTLRNIEQVIGTALADTFIGGDDAEMDAIGLGGDDTFRSGLGGSFLRPGAGNDTVIGGAGFDAVDYGDAAAAVTVNLRAGVALDGLGGTDRLSGVEQVRGGRFNDILIGTDDADEQFVGRAGADTINGGGGDRDEVRYDRDGGPSGVIVDLGAGTATDSHGFTDTLISIERVRGTAFADTLTGGDGREGFRGNDGDDVIDGGGGRDFVDYRGEDGGGRVVVNLATGQAIDTFGARDTLRNIEDVIATRFGDILVGGDGDDYFEPGGGADTITGGAGFDTVSYRFDDGTRGVVVNLATGQAVDAFGARDTLSGIERIEGTDLDDVFFGAADFESEFEGRGGADRFVAGAGGMYVRGGAGADRYEGGAGFDTVDFNDGGVRGAIANLATQTAFDEFANRETLIAIEQLRGGRFADVFVGDAADNQFIGRAGNDTLNGGGGFDTVRYDRDGGARGVVVNLGAGTATDTHGDRDTLISIESVRGTAFADTLVGSDGDNLFRGNAGDDVIAGRGGFDTLDYRFEEGGGRVVVNMGTGRAIDSFGGRDVFSDIERVRGTTLGDIFVGGDGDDQFEGRGGADSFDGRGGRDTVRFIDSGDLRGVVVNLATGRYVGGDGASGTIVNIERVDGTDRDDLFVAGAAGGSFGGGRGADTYRGGAGFDAVRFNDADATRNVVVNLATGLAVDGFGDRDTLSSIEAVVGGSRGDLFVGGAADETFIGLGGADDIRGGAGTDTVDYSFDAESGGAGRVIVNLRDGAAVDGFGATDTLSSIERAIGTAGADIFVGGAANETFAGLAGADTINGGGGFDFIDFSGDTGARGVVLNLGAGVAIDGFGDRDTIIAVEGARGSDRADLLVGSDRVDRLEGGDGADTLRGNGGNDVLEGGAGADVFQITGPGWGVDVVLDFEDGVDRIAVSGVPGATSDTSFIITQTGTTTRIAFGADAILLANTDSSTITDADFIFG